MDRRRILLVAAAVVAALGVVLVFLYVRGAENRAEEKFDTVDVLVANQQVEAGEPVADALASGKFALEAVPLTEQLPGASSDVEAFDGLVALTTIYPGEQLIPEKFGGAGAVEAESTLPIPEDLMALTVELADPERVAGFVNPGSEVAIFWSGIDTEDGDVTRLLLDRILVVGVGSTTQTATTTTTDESGAQTIEQLPRTLMTLALDQKQSERIIFAKLHGELQFALLTPSSGVKTDYGIDGDLLFPGDLSRR